MPFADRIQASFGSHYRVASIQAHVGGAAGEATSAMGASAYATSNHAVFSRAPDLHTAAHEAAHVVQQAHGVSLSGGVGQAGDRYEQQADAVADRVVAGQSAADLFDAPPSNGSTAASVQRQTPAETNDHGKEAAKTKEDHGAALAKIQGYPMYALLPALEGVGDAKTDFSAGQAVGGPRLVTAMKAVAAKSSGWMAYVNANHGEMGTLPADQIRDIMAYLEAPKTARYYKDVPGKSRGKFDGAVDPASQVITLFFRAKLVIAGAEQGVPHQISRQTLDEFKPRFKEAIQQVWSGGHIKPAKAIAGVSGFTTKTNVAVVDAGEHLTFYVTPDDFDRSSVNDERGKLREGANKPNDPETCELFDDTTGTKHHPVTNTDNTQTASAHEFGHAVGLDHPRPQASTEGACAPSYGKTAEERGSIMGTGHELRVIQRGGVNHNDFGPFISIGEKWGSELLPASLASHNTWSAG